jgi:hypothetical protein
MGCMISMATDTSEVELLLSIIDGCLVRSGEVCCNRERLQTLYIYMTKSINWKCGNANKKQFAIDTFIFGVRFADDELLKIKITLFIQINK